MSTVFEFGALIHNPLLLHPWMVEQHLLPEHGDCPECGATMKPGIGTTTLCCSKRFLYANNKAVKVSWLKGTFYESRGGVPKNEEAYGMHFGKFLWFRKNKAAIC